MASPTFNTSNSVFQIQSDIEFNEKAIELFYFQASFSNVYADYLKLLGKQDLKPESIFDIPFMPISFFKTHKVLVGDQVEKIFTSSGTGGIQSKHYVKDLNIYKKSYETGFRAIVGDHKSYTWLCLLPSYLEREGSSLIDMAEGFVKDSDDDNSGFYLHNHDELKKKLVELKAENKPAVLLGVSFALLDLCENFEIEYPELIVMETGGMKGKRKEITRAELHKTLQSSFKKSPIMSEYGMTELLSQAYSVMDREFVCPPWMKVIRRTINDPFDLSDKPGRGGLNVLDLANIYSCSFIATDDLVELQVNGSFKVNGRIDNSDIRGCNLMVPS